MKYGVWAKTREGTHVSSLCRIWPQITPYLIQAISHNEVNGENQSCSTGREFISQHSSEKFTPQCEAYSMEE